MNGRDRRQERRWRRRNDLTAQTAAQVAPVLERAFRVSR